MRREGAEGRSEEKERRRGGVKGMGGTGRRRQKGREGTRGRGRGQGVEVGVISASADFQALPYMFYVCFFIYLSRYSASPLKTYDSLMLGNILLVFL